MCPITPLAILAIIGEPLLLSFTLTAFGVMMADWHVPIGLSLGIVAVTGLALLASAIAEFQRTE
jgi:hypothetical protein